MSILKNTKKTCQASFILNSAEWLLMFYFISATIGLIAFVLFPDISPDKALPVLIKNVLPIGVIGIVLATLLAVVMSTADSYLNSATVIFSKDIWQRFIEPDLSEKKKLWIERVVNLILGGAAVVFALYATSIVDALLLTYALWAPTVLIPFVLGVLLDLKCSRSAICAMLAGASTTALWKWGPTNFAAETGISALIAGVLANILIFLVVYKASNRNTKGAITAEQQL